MGPATIPSGSTRIPSAPTGCPGTFSFNGGLGNDKLIYDSSDATAWSITGDGDGDVNGQRVDLSFIDVENLEGADGNADTFTFASAGKISGIVDGGYGGHDTVVYSGGLSAMAGTGLLGANGSGSVGLSNSSTLKFENMEPFAVGGGIVVEDLSGSITAWHECRHHGAGQRHDQGHDQRRHARSRRPMRRSGSIWATTPTSPRSVRCPPIRASR